MADIQTLHILQKEVELKLCTECQKVESLHTIKSPKFVNKLRILQVGLADIVS